MAFDSSSWLVAGLCTLSAVACSLTDFDYLGEANGSDGTPNANDEHAGQAGDSASLAGAAGAAGSGEPGPTAAGTAGAAGSPPTSLCVQKSVPSERRKLVEEAIGYAEGVKGGADGCLVVVTDPGDSGPGTLREALSVDFPAWIVFDMQEATISLEQFISVTDDAGDIRSDQDLLLNGAEVVENNPDSVFDPSKNYTCTPDTADEALPTKVREESGPRGL
jgi:hypothetical protein